jgi:hypothetical protein
MDWVGYEVKIQSKYRVEVVGNVPIPRTRPATWPLDTVLAIRDGLVNSTIDFMPMTKDQIAALATKHKVVHAAGGTVWLRGAQGQGRDSCAVQDEIDGGRREQVKEDGSGQRRGREQRWHGRW